MKRFLYILIVLFYSTISIGAPNPTIGGIGGQAVFDSTAQRFKVKSLDYNNYFKAKTLKPGDLILEIDKVPIHKMSYGEVLKLVQGTVGTPMSLKIQRYNAIEKYYEIKRIRVTLDMNPVWWSVPDYRYINFQEAIPYIISQLKVKGRNSIDTTKVFENNNQVFCNFNIKGAYESKYINNGKGGYSYQGSFVKTDDRSKAEGMYNYLVLQLRNYSIKNVTLLKTESVLPAIKTYTIKPKEVADIALYNLHIDVILKTEFDKEENKNLWSVEMNINL
ncbi:MAG: hypothetical protein RJA25_2149 [Bacteroidota bacterium]|jgi:hypothetical protein